MSNPKSVFPNLLFLPSFNHKFDKKHIDRKNSLLHKDIDSLYLDFEET